MLRTSPRKQEARKKAKFVSLRLNEGASQDVNLPASQLAKNGKARPSQFFLL